MSGTITRDLKQPGQPGHPKRNLKIKFAFPEPCDNSNSFNLRDIYSGAECCGGDIQVLKESAKSMHMHSQCFAN